MAHWFEDRIRAAARLLTLGKPPLGPALLIEDPRTPPEGRYSAEDSVKTSRSVFELAARLTQIEGSRPMAVQQAIKACARLELELRTGDYLEEWDRHLAIATCKIVLPACYSDDEAKRALFALTAQLQSPRFGLQSPAWHMQVLADLATLGSASRSFVYPTLERLIKELVAQLTLLRDFQDELVAFGGPAVDPSLSATMAAMPHGGVSKSNSIGRLDWTNEFSDCRLWASASPFGLPALEMRCGSAALFTTSPTEQIATAPIMDPAIEPVTLSVRRRDTDETQTLDCRCDLASGAGQEGAQWGRRLELDRATGSLRCEDWTLPPRNAPGQAINLAGSSFVFGPQVQIAKQSGSRIRIDVDHAGAWTLGTTDQSVAEIISPKTSMDETIIMMRPLRRQAQHKRLTWTLDPYATN